MPRSGYNLIEILIGKILETLLLPVKKWILPKEAACAYQSCQKCYALISVRK